MVFGAVRFWIRGPGRQGLARSLKFWEAPLEVLKNGSMGFARRQGLERGAPREARLVEKTPSGSARPAP